MDFLKAMTMAYAHMSVVKVSGEENMRNLLAAMEHVKAAKNAIETMKEEAQHEDSEGEKRADV